MANVLRASAVDNALGIQPDLVYGNWSTIPAMIAQAKFAGVDTLRIAAPTTNNPYGHFDQLAEAGLKLEFVADTLHSPQFNVDSIAAFITKHPGSVAFVEGPNEPNNYAVSYGGQSGVPAAIAWQADFYAAMNANPITAPITVAGMSSWPAVAAASDVNNMHIYPYYGNQPGAELASGLGVQNSVDPGKGFVVTEMGWYTAPGVDDPNAFIYGVDEPTQAKLLLNAYMDGVNQGGEAVVLTSLRDWVYTDVGAHYGIFHSDGTPKAAATALHNVEAILNDPGANAASFATQALDYRVDGPAGIKSMVMQKSSGEHVLALWAEPDVWNETSGTANTPAAATYTLHLGAAADAAVYDPLTGAAAIQTAAGVHDLAVSVSDHPIFVTLNRASEPSEPLAASPAVTGATSAVAPLALAPALASVAAATAPVVLQLPTASVLQQEQAIPIQALAQDTAAGTSAANNAATASDLSVGQGPIAAGAPIAATDIAEAVELGAPPASPPHQTAPLTAEDAGAANLPAALSSASAPAQAAPENTLKLLLSGDQYDGAPIARVSVDGHFVGDYAITANHQEGEWQSVTIAARDEWLNGDAHSVDVMFINDKWDFTPETDRNLWFRSAEMNADHTTGDDVLLNGHGMSTTFVFTETSPAAGQAATPEAATATPEPTPMAAFAASPDTAHAALGSGPASETGSDVHAPIPEQESVARDVVSAAAPTEGPAPNEVGPAADVFDFGSLIAGPASVEPPSQASLPAGVADLVGTLDLTDVTPASPPRGCGRGWTNNEDQSSSFDWDHLPTQAQTAHVEHAHHHWSF